MLTALAALVATLGPGAASAFAGCPDEDLVPAGDNVARVTAAVVCLHNAERRAAGVGPLRSHRLLAVAATRHADDMVERRYFDHTTPDGLDPFGRMRRAGYIQRGIVWNAGENIGWATGALATPRSMMDAWLRSYGHRLTLQASDFAQIGVGIAFGAPSSEHAARADAVTYAIDFGWREPCRRARGGRCRAA